MLADMIRSGFLKCGWSSPLMAVGKLITSFQKVVQAAQRENHMGTWAEGNFDNDGAMDYVGELVNQFAETIDDILNDEDRSMLDEEGEAILMPSVELIALICERYNVAPPEV